MAKQARFDGETLLVRIFDFSEVEAEVNHFWLAGYPVV